MFLSTYARRNQIRFIRAIRVRYSCARTQLMVKLYGQLMGIICFFQRSLGATKFVLFVQFVFVIHAHEPINSHF